MKVVCEVGSNWRSLQDCIDSIHMAKAAGADAVKFQLFKEKDLYGFGVTTTGKTPYLDPGWIQTLKTVAEETSIEFMCTAFSCTGYYLVDPFVKCHKIASAELTDTSILETVNSFGKPVLLSTGGSSFCDIEEALNRLKNCPVTLMFCVADYPASVIDFRQMEAMKWHFANRKLGFSDHSIDAFALPLESRRRGASVIEKHVNFFRFNDTPDAAHSIGFDEFSFMIKTLKSSTIPDTTEFTNREMRRIHRRRFIATTSILRGEILQIGINVGIYRPSLVIDKTEFVSTFFPDRLDGQMAIKNLLPGEAIAMSDIKVEPI